MSNHLNLDEYSTKALKNELERRRDLRDNGRCDYCGRYGNTPDCKFPERHAVAKMWWENVGKFTKGLSNG